MPSKRVVRPVSTKTKVHISKKRFLTALEQSLGVVTQASKISGLDRALHYRWLIEDKAYADSAKAIENVSLDYVESKLFSLINDKNPAAIIFYLKTKGKKRGYIETIYNMNQNFDENNVHIYIPDNERDEVFEDAKLVSE